MTGLLIFLGIVALIVGAYVLDKRDFNKRDKEMHDEIDAWLKEANKDLWCVQVLTKSGKKYRTGHFEPQTDTCYMFNRPSWRKDPSKDRAVRYIGNAAAANGIWVKGDLIPMCDIEKMTPVRVKQPVRKK